MLIRIGEDRAIFSWRMANDPGGFRLFDRRGRESRVDLHGHGSLQPAANGQLLFWHDQGVARIDPAQDFARIELKEVRLEDYPGEWSDAFLGTLVDTDRNTFARFELDADALDIQDPGYSGPVEGILLPDRRRVAIAIARSDNIAIFDPVQRTTRLIRLGGSSGSRFAGVHGQALWLTNYDRLCRLDQALELYSSDVLQPSFPDPSYGFPTAAFVGQARRSARLGGWLIPRPYSGDILLVHEETLKPVGKMACGGRPYDVIVFDADDLLILDHPFKVVRVISTPPVESV